MGNCEEAKDCKPEEASSPPAEQQQTSRVYSDWASMQAYYGPRMAVPPYFSSAVASPYMWGPLPHMMPPYAAIYPHGGVYAHPGVTVAGNPNPTPIPIDSSARSPGNSNRGLIKKLKGIDHELTMSIGNNNGTSDSRDAEGSSEGSDGNTSCKNGQKSIRAGASTSSEVGKTERTDANGVSKKVTGVKILGKEVEAVISGDSGIELELKKSPASASNLVLQDERELKREKRKQSNRESARRSRLRKQAEAEELGTRVEALTNENLKLKSEINWLTVNSTNLKLQNAILLEKLKKATEGPRPDKKGSSLSTANLLSRVDNRSGSLVGDATSSGSGAPLHQLLDANPRPDAVAAGAG